MADDEQLVLLVVQKIRKAPRRESVMSLTDNYAIGPDGKYNDPVEFNAQLGFVFCSIIELYY